tara:strand:- start:207 stop:794 length:588 start_codon:yes stop_codon:yes gene_type:complete
MYLPKSLPDELFFSRLVRHCILIGMETRDYMNNYFGSPKKSVHPFLTANFIGYKKSSEEDYYSIIQNQTLAPLFIFFLPKYSNRILEELFLGNTAKAFRYCQLPSFKARERTLLYSCSRCVIEDIEKHGVSYWHKQHHIPGCHVCANHGIYLTSLELPERLTIDPKLLPEASNNFLEASNNPESVTLSADTAQIR